MRQFEDAVAVITGAASGIGCGLAEEQLPGLPPPPVMARRSL